MPALLSAAVRPADHLRRARRRASLARRPLGLLVGVGAGVDRVEHGQPRVGDGPGGVVEGVYGVCFGPAGVGGGGLGVQLPGPLVDLGLDVVPPGRGVGLDLRPLASSLVGDLAALLLGFLDGLVEVVLGLVDALLELVTRLGGGSLCRRLASPTRFWRSSNCAEKSMVAPLVWHGFSWGHVEWLRAHAPQSMRRYPRLVQGRRSRRQGTFRPPPE